MVGDPTALSSSSTTGDDDLAPLSGVRWLSVRPGSGLGDASDAYLSGLRELGVPVTWSPLGWPSTRWKAPYGPLAQLPEGDVAYAPHSDVVNRPIEHDTVVVCSTPLWDEQLAEEARGRRLVAYTASETDRLPEESVTVLNHYDQVLVPSKFSAEVCVGSGVSTPVVVVPHCAPPIRPLVKTRSGNRFVFYVIATWTTRKAVLDSVSAYVAAFSAEDDVALVVHTTPEDHIARARVARGMERAEQNSTSTWLTLAKALAGRTSVPEIILSTNRRSARELRALHEDGDCFLSLSRGEAWGLGAFDAGAFANPVIATGWGGTLEFLPTAYPYCVEYDLVPTVLEEPDAWWEPSPGERWARARVDHASALLRHIYEHRGEAQSWGARLQEHIYERFTRAQMTRRLLGVLRAVEPQETRRGVFPQLT